ncbi:tissue factor-like isoform X2 [Pungitius pungitius]|uniref:tissue factor-like isoform X2 n=1 Tax=Pungitius pungitius TaxID=134920 RepID=UPI002E16363F
MASLKNVLYLGVCLSAWTVTTADENVLPKAENVRWVSVDFKIIVTWTVKPSAYKYTVSYYSEGMDWNQSPQCFAMSHSECDLTNELRPWDRTYIVKIQTEPDIDDYDNNHDVGGFPYTESTPFNPYRDTNISAANFTIKAVDESTVLVNITDLLSAFHDGKKQFTLRDIFKNDLKYKISYHQFGNTGKRDIISDSSTAEVSKLDAGQRYCFMVAAFISSRPKSTQRGAWSIQQCTPEESSILQELTLGAWVCAVFILLTVLAIVITVTFLCCRCYRQKNTSQSSAPV